MKLMKHFSENPSKEITRKALYLKCLEKPMKEELRAVEIIKKKRGKEVYHKSKYAYYVPKIELEI